MANKVTSKRNNAAKKVSHSHIRTNKTQKLNFQKTTIDGVKVVTTAREARTFKKNSKKE